MIAILCMMPFSPYYWYTAAGPVVFVVGLGVLREGVDRFSIERIARDMLSQFQSTLAAADDSPDAKWENQ